MHVRIGIAALALATFAGTAAAQVPAPDGFEDRTKPGMHEWMRALGREVETLRAGHASPSEIERVLARYRELSARLGGDEPAGVDAPSTVQGGAPRAAGPACAGSAPLTTSFSGTTGSIPDISPPAAFTAVVSGLGSYLWDVDLTTAITHTACGDLDITLRSPAGTAVTISTDNGAAFDDVFDGTLWDDHVNDPVADRGHTNNVTSTPLSPEGRLQAFRGENPNGTWTLEIRDDATGNAGALNSWSLAIAAISAAPSETTTTFSESPGLAIGNLATVTDTTSVSGLATFLDKVALYVEIPHTFAADLDVDLTSPSGTLVKVTTDNGISHDNVFNGTLFDPEVLDTVTDHVYTNLVVATPLSPEGAFDNFTGQDPNGTWTLRVGDDGAAETGTLLRWDLSLTTTSPVSATPVSFAGTTGTIPDLGVSPPLVVTAAVSGMGPYLWDLDLTTAIAHTAPGDLDVTLTSPAGTTVTVTTDNGAVADHVFNGTLWDGDVNDPATDHTYANATLASPLSPEGSFDAFRGENPNGTWTLVLDDDFMGDAGSLTSWSLGVTTLTGAPGAATATFSSTPALAIVDVSTVTDSQVVTWSGTQLAKVALYTEIVHSWCSDLDVYLTSPAGTVVAVTTDNATDLDDVYFGTTWDPDGTDTVTDHVYVNAVAATPLTPEGSFANFIGEDPNGTWTLSIADDFVGDDGVLARWDLTLTACAAVVPPLVYCTPIGTTFDGCAPSVDAPTQPNTTHTSGCAVTFENLPDHRNGIVFYSANGAQSAPWCAPGVGNSMLCVVGPNWRTGLQDSGGGTVACDGALFLDWDAYQLGTPGAQGQPWSSGDKAWVQGWFRSPADCRTTFLTEAVELTYQ